MMLRGIFQNLSKSTLFINDSQKKEGIKKQKTEKSLLLIGFLNTS